MKQNNEAQKRASGKFRQSKKGKKYRKIWLKTPEGKAYQKACRETPKAKARNRNYNLIKKYGITQADYEDMYTAINGSCEICGEWFEVLVVDHDHTLNKV